MAKPIPIYKTTTIEKLIGYRCTCQLRGCDLEWDSDRPSRFCSASHRARAWTLAHRVKKTRVGK